MDEQRIGKLQKWAQGHIDELQQEIAVLKAREPMERPPGPGLPPPPPPVTWTNYPEVNPLHVSLAMSTVAIVISCIVIWGN